MKEEQSFWDELAKRLRQEQEQPFREEDWASVHRQLQERRKRRGGWIWPAIAVLFFLGNNLIWWLLWQQSRQHTATPAPGMRPDTVLLIRERIVRDTIWHDNPAATGQQNIIRYPSGLSGPLKPEKSETTAFSAQHISPQTTPVASEPGAEPDAGLPVPTLAAPPARLIATPPHIPLIAAPPVLLHKANPRRTFVAEISAGPGFFSGLAPSEAWLRQYGGSLSYLHGAWGIALGLRGWQAGENPDQQAAKIGLPDECENCPSAAYPDQVRLQWTEMQFGPVYRLPWPKGRTRLYVSLLGHLRGRVDQYRHFTIKLYGTDPPIEVDDRYREPAGLYWNGFSGRLSATHRLYKGLALYGALEARSPAAVTPYWTPSSLGLNLGLAWTFKY